MSNRTTRLVELREALDNAEVTDYTIEHDEEQGAPNTLRVVIPVAEREEIHIHVGRSTWPYELSQVIWAGPGSLVPGCTETALASVKYPELAVGTALRFIAKRAAEKGVADYRTITIPGTGETVTLPAETVDHIAVLQEVLDKTAGLSFAIDGPGAVNNAAAENEATRVLKDEIDARRQQLNESLETARALRVGEPIDFPSLFDGRLVRQALDEMSTYKIPTLDAMRDSWELRTGESFDDPTEPVTKLTLEEVEVRDEMARQDARWGQQDHPDGTGPERVWVFTGPASFVASSARKACEAAFAAGHGTWEHILTEEIGEAYAEDDPKRLLEELLQAETVIRQWRRSIRRRMIAEAALREPNVKEGK